MSKIKNLSVWLWITVGLLFLGLLFARILAPDLTWLTIGVGVLFLAALALLAKEYRKALSSRTAAFGLHSFIHVLIVLSIVGVLNFLGMRYPWKHDFTANKVHTLSDQTQKLIKGLTKNVQATFYAKAQQQEAQRAFFDNYSGLSPKFKVEYVDPDKETTRAKQQGIQRYNTLVLAVDDRNQKIEEPNEEKVTNALIKLLKDKKQELCVIAGHGEKNFDNDGPEGYQFVKKGLEDQAYVVRVVELPKETQVPAECSAIAVIGPTSSFFEPELKALSDYLSNGGRAIFALDIDIKGKDLAPELARVLAPWHVKPKKALIVDPLSRMFGVDAAMPIIATYAETHPVTKEFKETCYFPFTQPIELLPNPPASLKVEWFAKSTPKSWGETNLKEMGEGKVSFSEGSDLKGPLDVAAVIQGKLEGSKAERETRIIVFGTSHFATNNFSRFGKNIDLFLNSVSWVLEDESMISIRSKEDEAGKLELTQTENSVIRLIVVFLLPLIIAVAGIVVWVRRRRL